MANDWVTVQKWRDIKHQDLPCLGEAEMFKELIEAARAYKRKDSNE